MIISSLKRDVTERVGDDTNLKDGKIAAVEAS